MKSLARALPAINLKGASIESVGKINPGTLLGSGKIDEIQKNLDNLLSERLKVEDKLLQSRKSIEECNASIHKIEREKIEKEQAAITLRELLENLRLERQASKIEQGNIETQVQELQGDMLKIRNFRKSNNKNR